MLRHFGCVVLSLGLMSAVASAQNSRIEPHIIIDREGNIEAQMIGGSENRHEEIRPLIARLLKGK